MRKRRHRAPPSRVIRASNDRVEWLRAAANAGTIHTVRASFADRLGHWRGKRIPAGHFVEHLDQAIGFCDGMLVCDVRCDIIEETPYSNYRTGYPDVDVRFDLARLRPVGWIDGEAYVFGDPHDHDGRPSAVSPRHVLRRVLGRLEAQGIRARVGFQLGARFMHDRERPALIPAGGLDPGDDEAGALTRIGRGLLASEIRLLAIDSGPDAGAFRINLAVDEPMSSAESAVVAKGAAKEIARQLGVTASFMTLPRHATAPSLLEPLIELDITRSPRIELTAIRLRLAEIRSLTQPSVNAFKVGPPSQPTIDKDGSRVQISGLAASSEADPFTVTAAMLAALGVAIDSRDEPTDVQADAPSLAAAADQLDRSAWAADWLGPEFVANSVPLLLREDRLFRSSVTDWEVDRYWDTA
jgi:glutamine synthetase